jgi:thiamine biosynthesis lipoprotein
MKENTRKIESHPCEGGFLVSFFAMASPCEVIVETNDEQQAISLGRIAANEAWRIEQKYSRYSSSSLCSMLNTKAGTACPIDNECFNLLTFANHCYELSNGLFDITSGVLRQAWTFDGSDNIPSAKKVKKALKHVGWQHVKFDQHTFCMQPNMEIDFGGLGKEYAVDSSIKLINEQTDLAVLINYGGDLAVNKARKNNTAWQIGIDHPGFENKQPMLISLKHGAIATSGDAKRYLLKNGKRYSHILNTKTGWPIENAPKSLTVAAPQCIQAGFIATLGLLQGKYTEQFLDNQEITYWCIR